MMVADVLLKALDKHWLAWNLLFSFVKPLLISPPNSTVEASMESIEES
jgi:hypothetical protein